MWSIEDASRGQALFDNGDLTVCLEVSLTQTHTYHGRLRQVWMRYWFAALMLRIPPGGPFFKMVGENDLGGQTKGLRTVS